MGHGAMRALLSAAFRDPSWYYDYPGPQGPVWMSEKRKHGGNCLGDVPWTRPRNSEYHFFLHFTGKNSYTCKRS